MNDCIGRFLNLRYCSSPNFLTAWKDKFYISTPNYGQQWNKLKKGISSLCAKFFDQIDLKIVFVIDFKLGTFLSTRTLSPNLCALELFTQTVASVARTLGTRVSDHLGISPRTRLPVTSPKQSTVRDHVTTCGFDVNMEHFTIIDVNK